MPRPIRMFCYCVEEDRSFLDDLRRHLAPLKKNGSIDLWHPDRLERGAAIVAATLEQLDLAELVVLILSPHYLAAEGLEDRITARALELQSQGRVLVPILVRPARWEWTPLSSLRVLPADGRPVDRWESQHEAWMGIVAELYQIIKHLQETQERPRSPSGERPRSPSGERPRSPSGERRAEAISTPLALSLVSDEPSGPRFARSSPSAPVMDAALTAERSDAPPLRINQIFRISGQPDINFVAPSQLPELQSRLGIMGQGLVVEGPSGVGKTTAVKRAFADLTGVSPLWVSSKKPADRSRLEEVLRTSLSEGGHLVVDDFHHLSPAVQSQVADLIKILADDSRDDAKVTLIGINSVGDSLVKGFPDLANRFDVIALGRQPDDKINELIVRGEHAANVRFERRSEFIHAALGSFYTAQILCLEAALKEGIVWAQPEPRQLTIGPSGYVTDRVLQRLAFKYHEPLLEFASCDEQKPPRGACLTLLWLLSQEKSNASVSLGKARLRYSSLEAPLSWLMASNLGRFFETHPRLRQLFYYNRDTAVLSAEDPQLEFYLRHIQWPALARDSGHQELRIDPLQGPVPPGGPQRQEEATIAPVSIPESFLLHLSDVHITNQSQAVQWANQLGADVRSELKVPRLDAVILSGDIVNRGSTEEYKAAASFLLILKQEFQLSPQQFILVPGNHDVNWSLSKKAYRLHRREEYPTPLPLEDGIYFEDGNYVEIREELAYQQRFSPFCEFYRDVRMESYPPEAERQATLHHFPQQKLLILGLNSACDSDHHFRGRARINGVALGQALQHIRTTEKYAECLKLAVWHHPLGRSSDGCINDTGFMELLAQAGFRLALHGHIHKADNGLFRYDVSTNGRRIELLCAGTFGAPRRELSSGIPLQYQLLKLSGDSVTVETRRREEENGAWKPDARWTRGEGLDPAPRYVIRLSARG